MNKTVGIIGCLIVIVGAILYAIAINPYSKVLQEDVDIQKDLWREIYKEDPDEDQLKDYHDEICDLTEERIKWKNVSDISVTFVFFGIGIGFLAMCLPEKLFKGRAAYYYPTPQQQQPLPVQPIQPAQEPTRPG